MVTYEGRAVPMVRVGVFARFVLCGGGLGIASSAAVPLLAMQMPWVLANALITVAATILATELHARFTFGSGQRCGIRRHVQSATTAVAAYMATTAAMLVLHPTPGTLHEQVVYLTASALAGLGRFALLRLFVFVTASGVVAVQPTERVDALRQASSNASRRRRSEARPMPVAR
ncbi:GtrA family protein [Streptomyces sp. NPDC057253]|uniref:GtrA family protein n=1 Tax=Streptomyces sp. NPDC057253 TaxID=3346069 RepID=UPI0036324D63